MFQTEMGARRKNPTTGLLLCLFLGGIGAHRFYLGQVGLGVLYLCFVWTFVPAVVALVELFLIMGRVRRYNAEAALEITTKLKALRSGADAEALPSAADASSTGSPALAARRDDGAGRESNGDPGSTGTPALSQGGE